MKLPTLHLAFVIVTLLPSSILAQQSDTVKSPALENRISHLEERVKKLENLIVKLAMKKPAVEPDANAVRYAKFKKLQTDSAIVRVTPTADMTRESTLPQDIAFFPMPTDDGIRLGDTVYPIADAESQMLKWKKIANDNGVKNVQLWVVTDDMHESDSERLLHFGVKNFTAAGGENLKRYNTRWAETMKSFE